MSDPTARRGDNIKQLLTEIKKSRRGMFEQEIKDRLFELYRFGITEQTIDKIFEQLKNHNVIVGTPMKRPKTERHKPPKIRWNVAPTGEFKDL